MQTKKSTNKTKKLTVAQHLCLCGFWVSQRILCKAWNSPHPGVSVAGLAGGKNHYSQLGEQDEEGFKSNATNEKWVQLNWVKHCLSYSSDGE